MKKKTSFIRRNFAFILFIVLFWSYLLLSVTIPYSLTYFNRAYTFGYITKLDTFRHDGKYDIDIVYTFMIDQKTYKIHGSVNEESNLHKKAISDEYIKLPYVVVYCSIYPNINHMMLHCPKKDTMTYKECDDCFDNISVFSDWSL